MASGNSATGTNRLEQPIGSICRGRAGMNRLKPKPTLTRKPWSIAKTLCQFASLFTFKTSAMAGREFDLALPKKDLMRSFHASWPSNRHLPPFVRSPRQALSTLLAYPSTLRLQVRCSLHTYSL